MFQVKNLDRILLAKSEAQSIFPRILGHEAIGIIESIGEGVTDMEKGDHVIPIFNGECGDCVCCNKLNTNLCRKFGVNPFKSTMVNDGKCRFSTKQGQPIYHFMNTSTFTEYTVIDHACLVKIDTKFPLKKMSLLSCGVSTGVGAVWNIADVQSGSTVAVFGLGGVGLAVAEGARSRGASKIIGIDINPSKFTKGRAIGITDFINPKEIEKPLHEIIREMTNGGVDYSFECAGNLQVLREAFLSTQNGWGLTVLLGVHPGPNLLPLHPMELFEGRHITASVFGGFKGKTQLPTFAQQCTDGVVKLDEFISHELPFDKINDAFQLLVEGDSIRCLLQL
ncbi:hypothetical protein ACFE04_011804 [Oxalis oulophora]